MKTTALLLVSGCQVSAALITQWDFATGAKPSFGSGTLTIVGKPNYEWVSGDPLTATALNTSPYPAQCSDDKTAGIQCNVNTLGYRNIRVSWFQRVSPTASKYSAFQWSTNGINYQDAPFAIVMDLVDAFELQSVRFAPADGADDNALFSFRIVSEFASDALTNSESCYVTASGKSYTTLGTVRFDLISISGNTIAAQLTPSLNSGSLSIRLTGLPGSNYVLQYANEASGPSWSPVITNTSPFTFSEPVLAARRFYRAILLP